MMGAVDLWMFAFLAGMTFCGLSGSVMELATGRILSFGEPYVSTASIPRSLAATMLAGPLMLANEALEARRGGTLGFPGLLAAGVGAFAWASATGVLLLELAWQVVHLI